MLNTRKARAPLALAAALGLVCALGFPQAALATDGYKFLESVKKSEIDEVKKALASAPMLVNTHDSSNGETPLMIATARGDVPWINYLIINHADVNGHDDKGLTPLMIAARARFAPAAEVLVDQGAKLDVSDRTGETPLITAVHNHDVEMMRVLLKGGADPDRSDNSGRSARDYARLDPSRDTLLEVIKVNARPKGPAAGAAVYGPR